MSSILAESVAALGKSSDLQKEHCQNYRKDRKCEEQSVNECNENDQPGSENVKGATVCRRRASDSGLPSPRRVSGGGTPRGSLHPGGQKSSPLTQPRDTRSSLLRKSLSGSEASPLSTSSSACKDSPLGAAGSELSRLREDVKAKERHQNQLDNELAILRSANTAKDRALAKSTAEIEAARNKLTQIEGEFSSKVKEYRVTESENNKLRSSVQGLEREAEKLHRRLSASPKAVATLEAEVKALKAENDRLEHDSNGVYLQLRAKDKQLDVMMLEVEKARDIQAQNLDLENYMLDLRRQLQEATNERATLMKVQRQNRADMDQLTEQKEAADQQSKSLREELTLRMNQLKCAEDNASELSKELELKRTELIRVGNVASRALVREVGSLKEEGTVPFTTHKEEVMHLKGENERVKEKLRLAEKSAASVQLQMQKLYRQIDQLHNNKE